MTNFKKVLYAALITLPFLFASCNGSSSSSLSSPLPSDDLKKISETKIITYEGPKTLTSSSLCSVKVNEQELFVYETKVNPTRIFTWEDKTIKNALCYFDFEGEVKITITVKETVKTAKVSPLSYNIVPTLSGNTISFNINQPNNYVIEYNDDYNTSIHLFANPLEENPLDENNLPDNTIYIKPGMYDAGAIPLSEGATLYIAGGAYVYGNIRSELLNNITIRGRGIISGEIYTRVSQGDVTVPIEIRRGKNIKIEDIIILDPAGWATTFYGCDGLEINNIKIISARPNGDGLSIQGCRNVTVKGGFVRTWDDSLVVKNNDDMSSENITFDGVNIWTDLAQSMEIGFETHGAYIKDVSFKNITVFHSMHKATMSIHNADIANISNIRYENITLEDGQNLGDNRVDGEDDYFIDISIEYSSEWSESPNLGSVSDVSFNNINVLKAESSIISRVKGDTGSKAIVSNVTFSNMTYCGKNVSNGDDFFLLVGDNATNVKVNKGEGTGASAYKAYDLSELDKTKVNIVNKECIEQKTILVPDFAKMNGDLSFLGTPLEIEEGEISVTHGKGKTASSPIDDGSGSFDTNEYPASNLLKDNDDKFVSKPFVGEDNECIVITIPFNKELYVGTLRLIGDKSNDSSYKYDIEVRYLKKNSSGVYAKYTTAVTSSTYTFTPTKGNAIDINFSSTTIMGIQLKFYPNKNDLFNLGHVEFSKLQLFAPSLSYNKPIVDSTEHYDVYTASKITDGNPDGTSYYESNALPAYLVIDLKDVYTIKNISLHLPSALTWDKRTQDIELLGSDSNNEYDAKNTTFTSFFKKPCVFDPLSGNKVLIDVDNIQMRYLKIVITTNDIAGNYKAQLSEVYVFGNK